MNGHNFKVGDRVITTEKSADKTYDDWPSYSVGTVRDIDGYTFISVSLDNDDDFLVLPEEIEHYVRDNDRPASLERIKAINTKAIRSIYRFAERREDGTYGTGGYKPGDQIGHQVINTVRGLCDRVDYLVGVIEEAIDALELGHSAAYDLRNDLRDALSWDSKIEEAK